MENEYDYIIVGGGSAGAVVARRLADDTDNSVLLIEGGKAYEFDPKVLLLKESLALVGNPEYDYDYTLTPQERGNSLLRMSRARMLGGCSSHNDSWALRAPDEDFDRWASHGGAGWEARTLDSHWTRVLDEMRVHRVTQDADLSHAWIAAAGESGIPLIDNTQGEYGDGISWVSLNESEGVRYSTAVAYLYPTKDLPNNLTLQLETLARRIVIEDGRAVAVETNNGIFRARKEIILSAGAIDSPKLLMLSGIGPADHLTEVGVDVVADLPGVGANLQDHIETPLVWETNRDPGPSINGLDLGLYAAVGGGDSFNVQVTIGHFSYWLHAEPFDQLEQVDQAFTFAPNVARPASHGTVRLASNDWQDKPLVDPRYFTDPEGLDEALLVEGIRLGRKLASNPSLKDWVVREVAPGPDVQSDEDLGAYARKYSNTVYHPTATCKMGADDDAMAVVDARLRVRGIDGLRVADASIFPEIVRVNPNMTVIVVGSRAAELIAEDHRADTRAEERERVGA